MDAVRQFHRMLYPCVEITADDMYKYPPLDDISFNAMRNEYCQTMQLIKVFVFLRCDSTGEKYFDLYICDLLGENEFERFIIQRNKYMEMKREQLFDFYCRNMEIHFSDGCFKKILDMCREECPDIHMINYKEAGDMLTHLYYSLHRCGPREILFKANLTHMAIYLQEVNDYNILAGSPSAILDVPLGFLRKVDSNVGVMILRKKRRREMAAEVYKMFHNYISEGMNLWQWFYLLETYKVGGCLHQKKYERLGSVLSRKQYLRYKKCERLIEELRPWFKLEQYPEVCDVQEYILRIECIHEYIQKRESFDKRMEEIYNKKSKRYEFEKGKYFVKMPKSILEVLEEAESQHNCLWGYVRRIVNEKRIILFMREKAHPNKSLVSIEIIGEVFIFQALQTCNKPLSEEQMNWLQEYARELSLSTKPLESFWDDEV